MNTRAWTLATTGIITLFVAGSVFVRLSQERVQPEPPVAREIPTKPTISITDPQRGNPDALITIVYYTDFGCEACAIMPLMISELENDPQFKGKLRFVWKDFPVHENIFPETKLFHGAARCAATAGKFWEYQEAVFRVIQDIQLNVPRFDDVARATGFDPQTLRTCAQGEGPLSLIAHTKQEALDLKLTATPTIFIMETDKRYDGIPPYYVLAGTLRSIIAERTLQ